MISRWGGGSVILSLGHRLPQLPRADVALLPGATLFVGSNGQGKTNLVEALGFLSTLGSHRVSTDQALIRQGAGLRRDPGRPASPAAGAPGRGADQPLGANRAQVNGAPTKPRELPRYYLERAVRTRGPGARARRSLRAPSVARPAARPAHPAARRRPVRLRRALKQRNTLLKSARAREGRPARHARHLGRAARRDRLADHRGARARSSRRSSRSGRAVRGASRATTSCVMVERSADDDDDGGGRRTTARAVRRARSAAGRGARELERGMTLVGPHRDDLLFRLNELPREGLREPRGVVVVRPRAEARVGRAAAARARRPGTRW